MQGEACYSMAWEAWRICLQYSTLWYQKFKDFLYVWILEGHINDNLLSFYRIL